MNSETQSTVRTKTADRVGYGLLVVVLMLASARFVMDYMMPVAETELALASLNGSVDVKAADAVRRTKEVVGVVGAAAACVAFSYWVLLTGWKYWSTEGGKR